MAFRVDASREIGLGHAMRCFALGQTLREQGWRTRFASRRMPPSFRSVLAHAGHEFVALGGDPEPASGKWPGESIDARDTVAALADGSWDWIVADHYHLGAAWESEVRQCARKIAAMDDIADRQHDCDVLLDQNVVPDIASRYLGRVPNRCRLLLGPRYALLRREFAALRAQVAPRSGNVRRLLILLGGMDSDNQTEKAVRAAHRARSPDVEVDVVVGAGHPALAAIQNHCDHLGFRCHVQADNIASLMAAADLSIGACGSTSWERCCLGLPAICMTIGDNQVPVAEGLASAGAIVNLGPASAVTEASLFEALASLMQNPARVAALSAACYRLVDGEGTARVSDVLQSELGN